MVHPSFHRLTALLLLAAYLAANTVGGLFHDHTDRTAVRACACHGDDADHVACAADDLAGTAIDNPRGAGHDHDCAVCRFVGQRPMPAEAGSLVALCQLRAELAVQHVPAPSLAVEGSHHSRAPPLPGVQVAG